MMVSINVDESSSNSTTSLQSPSDDSVMIIDLKVEEEEEEESMDASIENGGNDDERNCTSLESADYLGSLDNDLSDFNNPLGKRYFCQRCLNHGLEYQRKGHKPSCKFATCKCELCMMVEQRRQINYQLSMRKNDDESGDSLINGRKIRAPKCARCSAHGQKQALRGHKKATCPFNKCECDMCALVENRRVLMARQIRVRRTQQKQRKNDPGDFPSPKVSKKSLLKPQPQIIAANEDLISRLSIQPFSKKNAKIILGSAGQSAFQPTVSKPKFDTLAAAAATSDRIDSSLLSSMPAFTPSQMEFLMKLFTLNSPPSTTAQQQQPPPPSNISAAASSTSIPFDPFFTNQLPSSTLLPFNNLQPSASTATINSSNNNNNINNFNHVPFHHFFTGFPIVPLSSSSPSSPTPSSTSILLNSAGSMPSMVNNPFLFSCFQHGFQPFFPNSTFSFPSSPSSFFAASATDQRPS